MPPRPRSDRPTLSRERIVTEAVALADAEGLDRLSMRALAGRLGVEAMSLYHHVPNKDALLDAMVDAVFAELHTPVVGGAWRPEMNREERRKGEEEEELGSGMGLFPAEELHGHGLTPAGRGGRCCTPSTP